MNKENFIKIYWNYYLQLEDELISIQKYINFDKKNWKTYSNELIKLLDIICSEIDVIAKEIVLYKNNYNNEDKLNSIKKWGIEIQQIIKNIETLNVCFNNEEIITPWSNWKYEKYTKKDGRKMIRLKTGKKTPEWWISYNKVKHERTAIINGKYNYERANLKNVINALGGLYILEKYLFDEFDIWKTDYVKDSVLFRIAKQ